MAVVIGTVNSESLTGTSDHDVMYGWLGDDTIHAEEGNDLIYGDRTPPRRTTYPILPGKDLILAGSGDDTVYGEEGDDQILGDNGNDFLYGGIGNDSISGQAGRDQLFGDSGNDILFGDGYGSPTGSNDTINGGDGNDLLIGGQGSDSLLGGNGDDNLYGTEWGLFYNLPAGKREIDTLVGGGGRDTFRLGIPSTVFYSSSEIIAGGYSGDADYAVITDFTSGDDVIALKPYENYTLETISGVGTGIYFYSKPSSPDSFQSGLGELIGVVEGVTPESLTFTANNGTII